jgi:hypothetical protein
LSQRVATLCLLVGGDTSVKDGPFGLVTVTALSIQRISSPTRGSDFTEPETPRKR